MKKVFFILFFIINLVSVKNVHSQCVEQDRIINTNCTSRYYNCSEPVEVQDIRADQTEEYKNYCESTYDFSCTEISKLPGGSNYWVSCYIQEEQPTPTLPPSECGYLGGPCCQGVERKYYCLTGQGGPKTSGTGCICSAIEPTVIETPFPTSVILKIDTLCKDERGQDGVKTALGCIPTNDINSFAGWILGKFILIASGIAFLLMAVGAFQIITSSGDPKKTQAGKETLTSALTGLLFIILSIFLLKLIGVDILHIPGFGG